MTCDMQSMDELRPAQCLCAGRCSNFNTGEHAFACCQLPEGPLLKVLPHADEPSFLFVPPVVA